MPLQTPLSRIVKLWRGRFLLIAVLASVPQVTGQEAEKSPLVVTREDEKGVTLDEIKTLQEKATDDLNLTDEVRKEIADQLQKASAHVTSTTKFAEEAAKLSAELEGLAVNLPKLEARLKEAPLEAVENGDWKTDAAQLVANEKAAEAELAAAIAMMETTQREIDRRADRRPQLPELRATVAQHIADVETQLKAPSPDTSLLSVANRLRLVAQLLLQSQHAVLQDFQPDFLPCHQLSTVTPTALVYGYRAQSPDERRGGSDDLHAAIGCTIDM